MIKSYEDEEFERIERENRKKSSGMDCCTYDCNQGRDCPVRKELSPSEDAMGWRKRQMVKSQIKSNEVIDKIRNDTLEEVAIEFSKMKAFGATAESFACFVRNLKR
jgi:hypothetical protein